MDIGEHIIDAGRGATLAGYLAGMTATLLATTALWADKALASTTPPAFLQPPTEMLGSLASTPIATSEQAAARQLTREIRHNLPVPPDPQIIIWSTDKHTDVTTTPLVEQVQVSTEATSEPTYFEIVMNGCGRAHATVEPIPQKKISSIRLSPLVSGKFGEPPARVDTTQAVLHFHGCKPPEAKLKVTRGSTTKSVTTPVGYTVVLGGNQRITDTKALSSFSQT